MHRQEVRERSHCTAPLRGLEGPEAGAAGRPGPVGPARPAPRRSHGSVVPSDGARVWAAARPAASSTAGHRRAPGPTGRGQHSIDRAGRAALFTPRLHLFTRKTRAPSSRVNARASRSKPRPPRRPTNGRLYVVVPDGGAGLPRHRSSRKRRGQRLDDTPSGVPFRRTRGRLGNASRLAGFPTLLLCGRTVGQKPV